MPVRYEDLRSLVGSSNNYSVDELLKILSGVLTDSQVLKLVTDLTVATTTEVRPGGLITADWASNMAASIALLQRAMTGGGGVANDKLKKTLLDTWDAFSGLEKRGQFLPAGVANDTMRASLAIDGAIRAVVLRAMYAAAQCSGADQALQIELLRLLYETERDLAVFFVSDIPGAPSDLLRQSFASVLFGLLDGVPGSNSSLKYAINGGDPDAARLVQDRINGLVFDQAGEAISGNLSVGYRTSIRGTNLVLTDTGVFGYVFTVTNKTNRTLTVQIAADFISPKEWSPFATPIGVGPQGITLKPYDPNNPTDPAAFRDVSVNVRVPNNTVKGEQGKLRLTAFVPAPIGVADDDNVSLTISDAAVAPEPSSVKFSDTSPIIIAGSLSNAKEGDAIELSFEFTFATTEAQQTRDFVFELEALATGADLSKFSVDCDDPPGIDTASTSQRKVASKAFPLSHQNAQALMIQLVPNAGAKGTNLDLSASVKATSGTLESKKKAFSINVTG